MYRIVTAVSAILLTILVAGPAGAADGNWKVGRVYYRMVCTSCHKDMAGKAVSPSDRTKAEWTAYLAADVHDGSKKSNPKASYYTSAEYRESAKGTNEAARQFLKMPADELFAAIKAFVIYGAKDSDNPSSCQ